MIMNEILIVVLLFLIWKFCVFEKFKVQCDFVPEAAHKKGTPESKIKF
jgi:hypothetical protein